MDIQEQCKACGSDLYPYAAICTKCMHPYNEPLSELQDAQKLAWKLFGSFSNVWVCEEAEEPFCISLSHGINDFVSGADWDEAFERAQAEFDRRSIHVA